jgi:hypothetical protein
MVGASIFVIQEGARGVREGVRPLVAAVQVSGCF